MKIRITGRGFENYTGQMGVINFTDGLSDGDVLAVDAIRVAGVIGAEWEDGTPANVSQHYLDNMHTPAPTDEEQKDSANADKPKSVDVDEVKAKADAFGVKYTEVQLAAIADTDGIAGLRAISEPLGIKSNSITSLIASILKVAGTAQEIVLAPVVTVEPVASLVADITDTTQAE